MNNLLDILRYFNIDDPEPKAEVLNNYMEEILKLNENINLTAIKDRDEFVKKHYIDSLLCIGSQAFLRAENIIDVGTGAGFPGVPLAAAFPRKRFVLLDSLNKRVKIVSRLCGELGIGNIEVIHGRAEELGRRMDLRESFDLCVSRAVANMSTLCEYCMPFVIPGGYFIAYKGPDCEEEVVNAFKAIKELGGTLSGHECIQDMGIPGLEFDHRLIYISKVRTMESKYPRKPGIPSKEPIQ